MDVRARKRDISTVIALRLDLTEASDEYVYFNCFLIYVSPLSAN